MIVVVRKQWGWYGGPGLLDTSGQLSLCMENQNCGPGLQNLKTINGIHGMLLQNMTRWHLGKQQEPPCPALLP